MIDPPLLPALIVVTGRPASGKTSLAHALAASVRCPAICRDELKEGLVNTLGSTATSHEEINRQVYELFFQTIRLLLDRKITLIAEAAFQHKLWAPKLEPLCAVARVRIVVCEIDPKLARQRHIARGLADPQRERFHPDAVIEAARQGREVPIDAYDPPHLDVPTLIVDTTDGYQPALAYIAAFARGT